jgi:diacylglycerol kinase (ATP)
MNVTKVKSVDATFLRRYAVASFTPLLLINWPMPSTEPRGPRQILRAARYSMQGLRAAWKFEASFRLEAQLLVILLPAAMLLGRNAVERGLLAVTVMLVPAMELMNGGLESIVDKTTPEQHELAGRAKDMGSAAVFVCMLCALLVWGLIFFERFIAQW